VKFEVLEVEPLTKAAFAPFGDVIEIEGAERRLINNGTTERFHDLAHVEAAGTDARVLINIFRGQSFTAPVDVVMLERHPFGSQAFVPLNGRPFLVVVAEDAVIRASITGAMSGIIRLCRWSRHRIFLLLTGQEVRIIWRNISCRMSLIALRQFRLSKHKSEATHGQAINTCSRHCTW